MHRAIAVGLLIVLMAGALVGAAAASAATGMTRVGGAPPRPAGMRVLGSLPGPTMIPVAITLAPPDPAALRRYATAVSTPGSGDYRRYLSVAAFRARFAPTDARIAAVRSALSSDGLNPSPVSGNGLVIRVSGSATQLASAFSTSFDQVKLADGRTAYDNTSAPAVPNSIASTIQSVIGLNSLDVAQPLGLGPRSGAARDHAVAERPNVVTGGPQSCDVGRATPNGYTADDLASAYGFAGLYGQDDFGTGETIGLLELEPYEQSDISQYESCYDISPSVTNISVDGFNETGFGQGEANNDIEDVIGIAPGASVLVYQAPDTEAGVLDVLARMVSDDQADVMSTSWGSCEPETSPGFVAAENLQLEEAAIQGQSFFAAAGDAGSADCGLGGTELSVDDPAGQPFITAVGGTQLAALGPPPTETTWNDGGHADGGGISRYATMPAYQLDAAPSVTVIDGDSSGVPCAAPAGQYCRETPDVSASSSMHGGYDFYEGGKWTDWFGTSFAAPLWAAFTALADGSPACTGINIGFVNPLLYRLAGSDYGKYFNDITTGNNDAKNINGGLYPASIKYDLATGLGSPIGTPLAHALCDGKQAGVTFTNPGDQTGTAGTPVSLSLIAADVNNASITYAVQGLPAGLTFDATTGLITGTPTSAGVSTVTAVAADADGATATVVFGWTVAAVTPAVAATGPPQPPATKPPPATRIPHAVILKLKIAKQTNATITFTATGGTPRTYQCALVKLRKPRKHHRAAAPRPHYRGRCSSPVIYRHLQAARYEFFLHAKGISGGYSAAATKTFTIS